MLRISGSPEREVGPITHAFRGEPGEDVPGIYLGTDESGIPNFAPIPEWVNGLPPLEPGTQEQMLAGHAKFTNLVMGGQLKGSGIQRCLVDALLELAKREDQIRYWHQRAGKIREEALRSAAAAVCEFCQWRTEPAELREGIWVHPERHERLDGTDYDASPTCRAQVIHFLILEASLTGGR